MLHARSDEEGKGRTTEPADPHHRSARESFEYIIYCEQVGSEHVRNPARVFLVRDVCSLRKNDSESNGIELGRRCVGTGEHDNRPGSTRDRPGGLCSGE